MQDEKEILAETEAQKPKKKKKEKEYRKIKNMPVLTLATSYFMPTRNGASNLLADTLDIETVERYIREKKEAGMENISMMHVMIAAYVRMVACRPALNRFIRGQRIWTRNHVEIALTIKKEMLLDSPDTVIKVVLPKDATLSDVYEAMNKAVTDYRNEPGSSLDSTMTFLAKLPGFVYRFVFWVLNKLDYYSLLPKSLEKISPFHCSYFITSMGSLGIPPVFHHLYDFGTCPIFFAFGAKRRAYELTPEGTVRRRHLMDVTFTLDERICDGYYYANSLRKFKMLIRNPWELDEVPEVIPDID